jgi:hypothetical protein
MRRCYPGQPTCFGRTCDCSTPPLLLLRTSADSRLLPAPMPAAAAAPRANALPCKLLLLDSTETTEPVSFCLGKF